MENYLSICKVYSINIQKSQIDKVLTHDRQADPQAYQEEKNAFYLWLVEMAALGYTYYDQVYAWEAYLLYFDFAVEEVETVETNWLTDIEDAYVEQVNTWTNLRNYQQVGRHNHYSQQ